MYRINLNMNCESRSLASEKAKLNFHKIISLLMFGTYRLCVHLSTLQNAAQTRWEKVVKVMTHLIHQHRVILLTSRAKAPSHFKPSNKHFTTYSRRGMSRRKLVLSCLGKNIFRCSFKCNLKTFEVGEEIFRNEIAFVLTKFPLSITLQQS